MRAMSWTMSVAWLMACAPDAPTTPPGPRGTAAEEGPLDALPPCEALPADDRVDVREGCADAGCAWMSASELDAVWGDAACARSTAAAVCAWPSGVWAVFDDRDGDGVPDPDVSARLLFLDPPYDGASEEGLGVGASLSCFVDVLGPPDAVSLSDEGAGFVVRSMAWSFVGIAVYDHRSEGRAATVSLAGAE